MSCSVVCISKVTAAGGEAIARRVAERLGFRCVDDEVVALAAQHSGLDPSVVADAEHHRSWIVRLADAVFSPPEELRSYLEPFERRADYAATVPRSVAAPPAEEIRRLIDDAIVEIADRGSVVILAHAASVTLRNRPDVLRVHVVASIATRIHRLWVPNKLIAEREYARQIEESDHQRRKYLERFHGIDAEPPTLYDLVINTDSLDVDRAAAAIVAAVTT